MGFAHPNDTHNSKEDWVYSHNNNTGDFRGGWRGQHSVTNRRLSSLHLKSALLSAKNTQTWWQMGLQSCSVNEGF